MRRHAFEVGASLCIAGPLAVVVRMTKNKPKRNKMKSPVMSGIEKAVSIIGTQKQLAQLIGVKQQSVGRWVELGYVPYKRVQAVSAATRVPAKELLNPLLRQLAGED